MKTDKIFMKIDLLFVFICLFLVFFLAAIYSNIEINKFDIWFHLKAGELILENKAIPHSDVFSYTRYGHKWIDHEWLFQIIVFLFYNNWGVAGIFLMQTMVVLLVFLIFVFIGNRLKEYLVFLIPLLLCLYVFRIRFMRPEIFSVLFLAVYLLIIDKFLHSKWYPFVLIPVQIIWTNMHGFFFIGPLLLFFLIISDFIKTKFDLPWQWGSAHKLEDSSRRKLICVFLFLVLSCLVNPYFFEGAIYPLKVFFSLSNESKVLFQYISELRSPIAIATSNTSNSFWSQYFIQYIILVILLLLSFFFNYKKINIFHVLIGLLFFIFSTVSVRNLAIFCFIAYFIFVENMKDVSSERQKAVSSKKQKVFYSVKWIAAIFILLFFVQDALEFLSSRYYVFDKKMFKRHSGGFSALRYPEKAVDFILANNIKGNIYNEFNSGAYLIGRCYPQVKVFIDGRTEVYAKGAFEKYVKIQEGDMQLFDEQVKKYNITSAILNSALSEIPKEILNHLYNDPDWNLVYFDEFALVFLKDVKENRVVIKKFKIDLSKWQPPKIDLKELGSNRLRAYPCINRSYTLYGLNFYKQAISESEEAIRINPFTLESFKLLGSIYNKEESYDKAFENYRIAVIISPEDLESRIGLSLVYLSLGYLDKAREEMETAIKIKPDNAYSYYKLALILRELGQDQKVVELLKKSVKLNDSEFRYLFELGKAYANVGDFEAAVKSYNRALGIEPKNEEVKIKLKEIKEAVSRNKK